ncbi:unnamed protein product [Oikopleura dioica]|uniref:LRRCT domain-containing protein n=1 Tax=Oikopleura dioica TaxID=34765 RepID=E4XG31_OIKDI|nr:unnamed protein product [Oikopleura dioica]
MVASSDDQSEDTSVLKEVEECTVLLRPKLNVLDLSRVIVADSNNRKLDLSGFRNLHKIAVTSSNLRELPRFPSAALAINGSFNPLEVISKEVFKEQRNNLIIILRNCSLSSLEKGWARDLNQLEYLDLSRNLFTSLSNWMFSGLRSLKVLMLNENFLLRSLSTPSWSSVSSLSHLLLNNCNVTSIKPLNEVVNSLEALWLFSNPIECDCEAVPVLRSVINHNVTLDSSSLAFHGKRFHFNKDFAYVEATSCLLVNSPYIEVKKLSEVSAADLDCRAAVFRRLWLCFFIISALIGTIVVTSVMGYTCYMCDAVRRAVKRSERDPEEDLLLSSHRESLRKYQKTEHASLHRRVQRWQLNFPHADHGFEHSLLAKLEHTVGDLASVTLDFFCLDKKECTLRRIKMSN